MTPILFDTVQTQLDLSGVRDGTLEGTIGVTATQHVPQHVLDRIKTKRDYQDARTFSELTRGDDTELLQIAEIPRAVVWKWKREGFDLADVCSNHPGPVAAQMILARLRLEDLTAFQTTSKTFH